MIENASQCGKWPNESYSDSKQANLTGVFENSVDKVFTNHVSSARK